MFSSFLLPTHLNCKKNDYTIRSLLLLQLGELSMVFDSTRNMEGARAFCFIVVVDQQKHNSHHSRVLCRHKQPIFAP